MEKLYDIIVVGGGHAGCEAAAAAANLGSKTLLITMDMTKFAQMSCNPAMGGIAKGQIIREIDALGGWSGIVTDKSMIQFRMLNRSKGPAMWSPRAQCDRTLFTIEWRKVLEGINNLDLWQDKVVNLIIKDGVVGGVETAMGVKYLGRAVILTTGTFMGGLMHIGEVKLKGGRIGEPPSHGISEQLKEYGFEIGRMKTGTPARIDGKSIDFSKMTEQRGDFEGRKFSFLNYEVGYDHHKSCYIAYTNLDVHAELEKGFKASPLFNGTIDGIGPRYCPSIEDKIVTFSEKEQHQLFLEPEGISTMEYYINGFSSSLPLEVQYAALTKIRGLEKVKIFRPGYAIEYDYYPPVQLKHTLETKTLENLFFAGQINGTTGYEEAAAQGIMAGINSHLKISKGEQFVLGRDQAYIGVLIDDLINKGVDEPYRMFTSRAEYRILLRQDNADERLTPLAYEIGLASKDRMKGLLEKRERIDALKSELSTCNTDLERMNMFLENVGTTRISERTKLINIAKRPQVKLKDLVDYCKVNLPFSRERESMIDEIIESVEIDIKYDGYISRERNMAEKIGRLEKISIPYGLEYTKFKSISTEARQKLMKHQPETIGQALRISGVSPSDISVLLVYMGR